MNAEDLAKMSEEVEHVRVRLQKQLINLVQLPGIQHKTVDIGLQHMGELSKLRDDLRSAARCR